MAITFPLVTLADGALISKTFIDAVVDDINHLANRPDAFSDAGETGQTATTTTFTQLSVPSITVTPKITGNLLVLGSIHLNHSGANGRAQVRFDVNGSKSVAREFTLQTNTSSFPLFYVFAVTANVAYTIKLEFNNPPASGTVTATNGYSATIYAREAGA